MDFWDLVLNLIGKGGPILLVPFGVLILCQIHGSYSSRVMIFVFGLTSFDTRDFGGFTSSLWWIQTASISARSLGFTSSLELTFLRSWENPVLAREFLDSSRIMEWFINSFRGYVHKVFVIVPTNFELLWIWFDPPITEFFKRSRAEKSVSVLGQNSPYHRMNRRV